MTPTPHSRPLIAKIWNLSTGRISQLVRDGMPTTSVEDARQWRRARWLECEKNGPLPHFLNYEERVSLAQDIFDYAVYELGVSPQAACQIAFRIDCRKAQPWRVAGFTQENHGRFYVEANSLLTLGSSR